MEFCVQLWLSLLLNRFRITVSVVLEFNWRILNKQSTFQQSTVFLMKIQSEDDVNWKYEPYLFWVPNKWVQWCVSENLFNIRKVKLTVGNKYWTHFFYSCILVDACNIAPDKVGSTMTQNGSKGDASRSFLNKSYTLWREGPDGRQIQYKNNMSLTLTNIRYVPNSPICDLCLLV